MPHETADDPRWSALRERDATADGTFFYSVSSTGVYCYPSCAARLPKPENVQFHATREAAARAGFRPCKRCRPELPPLAQRQATTIERLCRTIESSPSSPTLKDLAEQAGWSTFHLQRVFKKFVGVSPKVYATAERARRVRQDLVDSTTISDAIYRAGFQSSGRFYAESSATLGMTPRQYRAAGRGTRIRFALGECSLGSILVAESDAGICAIFLGDEPEALLSNLEQQFPGAALVGADASYETRIAQIVGLVEAPHAPVELPLDIRGTAFQRRVWEALRRIPVGSTASYAEIAALIGAPRSTRAVAGACAANSLALAIPCHRVVRSDSKASGYRWGIERKRELLAREERGPAAE